MLYTRSAVFDSSVGQIQDAAGPSSGAVSGTRRRAAAAVVGIDGEREVVLPTCPMLEGTQLPLQQCDVVRLPAVRITLQRSKEILSVMV